MVKLAVVGAGGVGGYFGGRLAEHGNRVSFIARGDHLQAIRANGLKILSPKGDAVVSPVTATEDPDDIGKVDVVIVAVKGWQLQQALPAIRALLAPDTIVLPLLNGIDAPDRLIDALGAGQVIGGLCGIIAHTDGPGVIRHVSIDPFITLGEIDGTRSDRTTMLGKIFDGAGIITKVSKDVKLAMWKKFLFIAPVSGVTSVARVPIDEVLASPETRLMVEAATHEVAMVARAAGMALTDDDVTNTLGALEKTAVGGTTSMQRDIQSGNQSELDTQTGAIVALGKKYGIDVPVNDFIYASLLPQQLRITNRFESKADN